MVWPSFVKFGKAQKEQSTPRTNGGNVYHRMAEMCTIKLSVPMGMLCPTHFCLFLSGYKTMQSVLCSKKARVDLMKVCKQFANPFSNTGVQGQPGNWWFAKTVYKV
jgi:hypothetical protein